MMPQTSKQTDDLVLQLQKGSESAFSQLYDLYSSSIYGVLVTILRDESKAQDVLQDCFVTFWKKAPSYDREKGTFFTWMLNISRNKAIDVLRKEKRSEKYREEQLHVTTERSIAINTDTIGLREELDNISDEQRIVLELLYFKGYTQQEVADELEIPLGTVKSRTRYAMNSLRSKFLNIVLTWILLNT